MAHKSNVTGVMEELVDGPQNGRGANGRSVDAAIDVSCHIKNQRSQH